MTLVLDGHGTGEAWGLDLTPEGNIVTTGDDNKIVSFDVSKNQTVATGIVNPKAGRKHRIGGASTLSRYPLTSVLDLWPCTLAMGRWLLLLMKGNLVLEIVLGIWMDLL